MLFDSSAAEKLIADVDAECESIYKALRGRLSYEVSAPYTVPMNKPFLKAGGFSVGVFKWYTERGFDIPDIGGPFSRIEFLDPDMGSREKFKKQLLRLGWKPKHFTEKGSPKLTIKNEFDETVACPSLEKTLGDLGASVARYYIIKHRQSQTKGFLKHIRPDGRISAGANPDATNTHRMAHRRVSNVPRASSILGKEMRSFFTVPPGYKMVGADLSGLELRCLAHRMNDPEYIKQILSGDVHWYTAQLMQLIGKGVKQDEHNDEHVKVRNQEKKGIYTMIFGAGDAKFGHALGGGAAKGKRVKALLLKNLPLLDRLMQRVKKASRRGWLIGLDGRKIWMRRDSKGKVMEHKALNTLLQCDGALIMKAALLFMDKNIFSNPRWDVKLLITYHDEVQIQVREDQAEAVGKLIVKCFEAAGRYFDMNIEITGEYKVGNSWKDCH